MKFAVVGTNFISDRFAEACEGLENAKIEAVYSRKRDTGEAFAKKHSIPYVYTDYEEMLKSANTDAVYIASPTMLHKEHSILAMRYGKAVLCEKMITATLSEFCELCEAKERYGATVVEAMRCDFDVLLKRLPGLLPSIGRIKRARLEFCQYSSRYDSFLAGTVLNAFDPKMKNSALADIGIYPLHLCISLFGEPRSITASSQFLHNGFEGSGNISLDYGDFVADVAYSKTFEGENVSRIEGEGGTILIGRVNEPRYITVINDGVETLISAPEGSSNMRNEIAEFIRMATEDKNGADRLFALSASVMRWVDEAYRQIGISF